MGKLVAKAARVSCGAWEKDRSGQEVFFVGVVDCI